MRYLTPLVFLLAIVAASCQTGGVKPDSALAAMGLADTLSVGDATVILSGSCLGGMSAQAGFHYCRIEEGALADKTVTVHVPPAICRPDGASCVDLVWRRPGGQEVQRVVPRGQTAVVFPLSEIIGSTVVPALSRGLYAVRMHVKYVDNEGVDRESYAVGELRLRVTLAGYAPLHSRVADDNFVWVWQDGSVSYRYTAGLRASVMK